MRRILADPYRVTAAIALLVATIGVAVQIVGGVNYPVVPPGALILLAGAVFAVVPFRWAPIVSVLAGLFIIFGFVASGDIVHLVNAANATILAGKWVQLIGVVVATPAAVVAVVRGGRVSPKSS